MKRIYEIDWAANKDVENDRSVVSFSAVSDVDQYSGTFTITSTNDDEINRSFDWHLADHIRLDREVNSHG